MNQNRILCVVLGMTAVMATTVSTGTARATDVDLTSSSVNAVDCLNDDPMVAPPPNTFVFSVHVADPPPTMICGQEDTVGVRHINVGHPITDPGNGDFSNCVQDIFVYGRKVGPGTAPDSTQWNYDYTRGKTAIASYENSTGYIITAFTRNDGRLSNNWSACANAR